jgi:hypothetical protein
MLLKAIKWIGTAAAVSGATLIALRIGMEGYGFILFLVSSVLWLAAGILENDWPLMVLQAAFTIINILGIYRWTFGG